MISLEKPQRKWASSRLEGKTSWIFSSCGRCSQLLTVTSGTRSGGLRKGQSPCEFLGGLSGFLSRRSRGLRPCVKSELVPEDSSPVLTWILGYFWSLPRGVSPPQQHIRPHVAGRPNADHRNAHRFHSPGGISSRLMRIGAARPLISAAQHHLQSGIRSIYYTRQPPVVQVFSDSSLFPNSARRHAGLLGEHFPEVDR